jgi:opacity protein-like surface antigen
MSRLSFVVVVLLVPAGAVAGEWELGVFAGRSLPSYEQTFNYNPGSFGFPIPLPGVSVIEQGSFGLTARGGLAAGASLAYFPKGAFGIEARLDTASVNVDATGVRYVATVSAAPLASFTTSVDLPPGVVSVDRLTPISLGFRLRSPGRIRAFVSAGGSFLPKIGATVTQSLAISQNDTGAPTSAPQASIETVSLPGKNRGRWGVTAGAGLQIPLAGKVSFQAEARVFRFQKQAFGWQLVGPVPPTPLGGAVTNAVAALDPVEFNPTFYQVTAGFNLRF